MTRYRRLARWRALLVLLLFALAIGYCLSVSGGEPWTRAGRRGGDVDLYTSIVARVQAGEGYYQAMGTELRLRGYPTRSVLNWRTPLHLSLIARLRSPQWRWLPPFVGTLAAVALAFLALWRDGERVLAFLQIPVMLAAFPSLMPGGGLYAEVWAGVLIAISVGAYALGWWRAGAIAAILALFFRELALPYVLVSGVLAYRQARRSELLVLLAGMGGYAIYFALHAWAVVSHMAATDSGMSWSENWIRFGGVRFVLTASRTGLMLALPLWMEALYLPAALLGLAGWLNPLSRRILLTVSVYLLAFAMLGRPVQFYWGAVYGPLLSFGATWFLPAFCDLFARLARSD